MTDFNYEHEPSTESVVPLAELHDAELHTSEPYPSTPILAELIWWVLESNHYPYDDVRRWECTLHYFTLMKAIPLLFVYYANIRVTVLAKIVDVHNYLLEGGEFVQENRLLFEQLYQTMNELLVSIGRGW